MIKSSSLFPLQSPLRGHVRRRGKFRLKHQTWFRTPEKRRGASHAYPCSYSFCCFFCCPDVSRSFLKNPFLSFTGCWILVDSIFLPSRDNVHSHLASTISEEESAVIQTVFPWLLGGGFPCSFPLRQGTEGRPLTALPFAMMQDGVARRLGQQ